MLCSVLVKEQHAYGDVLLVGGADVAEVLMLQYEFFSQCFFFFNASFESIKNNRVMNEMNKKYCVHSLAVKCLLHFLSFTML